MDGGISEAVDQCGDQPTGNIEYGQVDAGRLGQGSDGG